MRLQAFLIIFAIFVGACSGITVSQDYDTEADFSALRTFAWKLDPEAKPDAQSEMSPLVATRVRNAIERELGAKGITLDASSPDFLIDYNLKVESKISSSNVGTTIGFGTGGYHHVGGVVISTAPDIRQYDEGTLYIDFYMSENDRLVWRGISSQVIDKHEAPDRVTEQINLNVQKILEQFPPKDRGAG
ncbi:MAG: DUF4136 domain-containing protein [Thiotrichales bacterium]|nr:MAG: DUF4136 domain-containing protein [Thiotrichales bacterium]